MAYQTNSNTTKCSGNYIFDCPSDKRIFAGKRRDLDIFFQLFAWVRHDELRRSEQVKVAGLPVKSRIQWFPRKFILYPDTCTFCCFDSQKLFNPKSKDACQSILHKQIEESTSLRFTNKKTYHDPGYDPTRWPACWTASNGEEREDEKPIRT